MKHNRRLPEQPLRFKRITEDPSLMLEAGGLLRRAGGGVAAESVEPHFIAASAGLIRA